LAERSQFSLSQTGAKGTSLRESRSTLRGRLLAASVKDG
jgi:hypothetical protein